jgi:hypothetical protein
MFEKKTLPLPSQSCFNDPPSGLQVENHQLGQVSLSLLLNHLHKSKVCDNYQL